METLQRNGVFFKQVIGFHTSLAWKSDLQRNLYDKFKSSPVLGSS